MLFIIIGAVLLAAAAVGVVVALVQQRRWRHMAAVETLTTAHLRDEAATVGQLGGGQFQRRCEVTGAAEPGPDGPLTAPMSGVSCVWHRQVVRRRFLRTTTDSQGRQRQQRRTEVVSDVSSPLPFSVVDGTGTVLVAPDGATVDRPERSHEQYRDDPQGSTLSVFGISLRLGNGDGTLGFETEEWVIRPGARLYVLGEATGGADAVRLGKPGSGRFLISTRDEAELTRRAQRTQRISMVVAAVAAVAGIAAIVAGLL